MYTPRYAQPAHPEDVGQFVAAHGFATLVNTVEGKLWATHTPLLMNEDRSKLSGHIARANKQWRGFREGEEVLAIFQGPHAYISSSWYDHENVPTWNYIAVHVYGTIHVLEGEEVVQSLRQLVDRYEAHSAKPVTVEGMSPGYIEREMKGLVAFEIHISSIEATHKLSQNRDQKNHENIRTELRKRGDAQSVAIADAMEKDTK